MTNGEVQILNDADITIPGETPAEIPFTIVQKNTQTVAEQYRVIRFRGRGMIMVNEPYPHFIPLHKENFDRIAYPLLGGVSRSRMNDCFSYLVNTAEDLTEYENQILFGAHLDLDGVTADSDLEAIAKSKPTVWDMDSLTTDYLGRAEACVWRSPYRAIPLRLEDPEKEDGKPIPIKWIMDLAGGDKDVYDDIMQSMAPIIMKRKPDGVVWWVGDGANGKSTLMDALYRLFPGQLSSITVKRLTDGRDTPSLNGTLANIVKESSEGRIDDTEIYKSIGTHENFRVHKFHSQDDIEIRGNLHHIFSANTIPSFNDKGYSARRRTIVIKFTQRFESDPLFEQRTFTTEMFGQLISELRTYAKQIKAQGYRYKWSAKTLAAQADYGAEASNAEDYAQHIIDQGVVAFDSFNPIRMDYENWCADEGYVPLGIGNLRRALTALGFERASVKEGEAVGKKYMLPGFKTSELQPFGMGHPGMWSVSGFRKQEATPPPEFKGSKPDEKKSTILKGKW